MQSIAVCWTAGDSDALDWLAQTVVGASSCAVVAAEAEPHSAVAANATAHATQIRKRDILPRSAGRAERSTPPESGARRLTGRDPRSTRRRSAGAAAAAG